MKFFWMIFPAMLLWFESGVVHAQETLSPDSEPTPSTLYLTKAVNKTLPTVMMEIILVNAIEQPPTAIVLQTDEVHPATSSSLPIHPPSAAETSTIMTVPTLVALSTEMQMHMHMLNGHQRRLGIVMGGLAAGVVALVVSWLIILFCHKARRGAEDKERSYKNNGVEDDEDEDEDDDLEAQRDSGVAAAVAIQPLDGFPPAYHMQDLPVLAVNIGIIFPQSRRSSMSSALPAYVEPPSYGDVVGVAR